jgi:hypothetical protein
MLYGVTAVSAWWSKAHKAALGVGYNRREQALALRNFLALGPAEHLAPLTGVGIAIIQDMSNGDVRY